MARVLLKQVTKTYAGGVHAVNGVDVDIADGEFIVLVGPSGCGKSTTLRMVAGLEEISGGEIHIGPRVVNDVPPKDRDIAMVFQNYALYPHMSVYKNMAFGLTLRQMPGLFERLKNPARAREIRTSIDAKVRDAAAMLEITHLLDRKPKALSGGQRQRVAVGRAIVREPACFLFDEPLSNLDAKLRVTTRAQLKQLHQRLKTTTIYVTHDQEEAMTLGDRIVVMKDGLVQQQDTPIRVYQSPANRFVASFIGMPPMNMFDGVLKSRDGRLVFEEGQLANATRVEQRSDEPEVFAGEVTTPGTGFVVPFDGAMADRLAPFVDKHVVLGIRPEHLTLQPNGGATVAATVEVTEPLGNAMDLYFRTALHDHKVARVEADPAIAIGQALTLHVDPRKVHVFEPGPTGRNLSLATRD